MSLGWGEVSVKDWSALKTKPGADQVPPGDYEVKVTKYLHFEPNENGVGSHVIVCETTANNADETTVGKELHVKLNYDLNPASDGRRKMNLISQQGAKALFEATAVEPVYNPSGNVDIVETLKALPNKQPVFVLAVKESKDPEYQETYKFRPSPGA